jgi:hypothetical protein
MHSRSFSSPVLGFDGTAEQQLQYQKQLQHDQQLQQKQQQYQQHQHHLQYQQQQQQYSRANSSCTSPASARHFSYAGFPSSNSSRQASPSAARFNSPTVLRPETFTHTVAAQHAPVAAAAAAAALIACEDDVCITASGWLDPSCQSGSAMAALQSLSLLAAASSAESTLSLAPCYAPRSANTSAAGGSSSSSVGHNGLLAFPSVLRSGQQTAPRDMPNFRLSVAELTAAATAGGEAAAATSSYSDVLTHTPCVTPTSSCPSSPQSLAYAASPAAAASDDLESQFWQMQLTDTAAAASPASSHFSSYSSRLGECHAAADVASDTAQLAGYRCNPPLLQPMQSGCSYSSVLPLPTDHFDASTLQAVAGCSASAVHSFSAPLAPAAAEPMQLAMAQQQQQQQQQLDEEAAIDAQLQQLLQVSVTSNNAQNPCSSVPCMLNRCLPVIGWVRLLCCMCVPA